MKQWILNNNRIRQSSQYVAAAVLSVLIVFFLLKLWQADLRVPLYYGGDTIFYSMSVKGMIDNGWFWRNAFIGAPGSLEMYDFPYVDNAVGVVLWVISIFTHNAALVMNLFYLLTFPVITLTSLYVFRRFNLSYVPALFCSLLYAFLPYHVIRNELHLILSAYYFIPLVVMVLLWVAAKEFSFRSKKFLASAVICIAVGSSGVYYPFFSCFMLLVAGAIGSLKLQTFRPLLTTLVLVGIIGTTVTINLSPSFIYRYKHGNVGVVERNPGEAESFGLKISQLILPITGHRIHLLDRIKRLHNRYTWFNESDAASLGTIGSIGFLALLAQLLRRKELITSTTPGLFHDLSLLNLFAVLLGVVGGFGYLFAVLISSGIRCYNRLSIFIAFFSLMAIGIGLEKIYPKTSRGRSIFCVLVALALIAGILDQTTPAYIPNYMPNHAETKAEYVSDEDFVNRIEASVPAGAMIFQLPYIQFPEQEEVQQMVDYDHFRGYVHSKNLRWSYGAMKNRQDDRVQERVAALPAEQFVQALAFGGFSGIYLDRRGYQDGGVARESELSNIIQTKPLISPNGRLLFFNLTDYTNRLRQKYSDTEWQERKELSFHPLLVDWTGGFSSLESGPNKTWRWSSNEGELHITNISQRPRQIRLEMLFATAYDEMDDMVLTGLISEQLKVNSHPSFYSKMVTVPPGEAVIKFSCSAPRAYAPLDTRFLVFRIEDFKMTELQ